jgi:site-specific recombinase XerD
MASGAFARTKAAALTFQPMMYMEEYLAELQASDKNADYIRTVRNGLAHFSDFARTEGIMHPEEITRLHLIRYQAHCNSGTWSESYRREVIKKVRAWLNWMESIGYLTDNPWVAIKVGATKKMPKPLSDEELTLLFSAHRRGAFNTEPFTFHRRELILCLLYGWGLRIHELEALNMANMDVHLDFVTAKNKGGGTKTLPYSPEMKRIFTRWAGQRGRYAAVGEDALLITQAGTRLAKEHIRQIVTDLGKMAGISINPHRLRDTCGTNLLDDDVPVERVAVILGHTNIKQTLAYSKVNDHKVAESHEDAMDPRLSALFDNTRNLRP